MNELDEAEIRLQKELELIRKKKEENKRQEEVNRSVTVSFLSFDDIRFYFKLSDTRVDVLKILDKFPSHQVHMAMRQRSMKLEEYKGFVSELRKTPRVFTYYETVDVKNGIEAWETRPLYEISLIHFGISNYYNIKCAPDSPLRHKLFSVEDVVYDNASGRFRVSLAYGYRVAEIFAGVERVQWTEDAYSTAMGQLEVRQKITDIALQSHVEGYETKLKGVKLRGFQEVGVTFHENNGERSLEVFSVGLGKTLIALDAAERGNYRTLIVCRGFLKINWERAVVKLTGKVPLVLTGMTPDKLDMQKLLIEKPQYTIINYDILRSNNIVDVEYVGKDGKTHIRKDERYLWAELLNIAGFQYLIGDEIQAIRNSKSSQSVAMRMLDAIPRVMVTTANPMFNNLGDLWPILNLLQPKQFDNKAKFLRDYTSDGKSPQEIEKLHKLLQPIMIQRKKKDVLPDLPPIEPIVQEVELSPKARKIYNKVIQGIHAVLDKETGEVVPLSLINNILAKINRAKMICSIDKQRAVADFAMELYDNSDDEKKKVIIGSQYKATVYSIARMLGNEALAASGDDNKNARMALIDRFQTDPEIHHLSAQMHSIGEGLDITEAGNVILADLWWNHAVHNQFIGRCYGRLNDLHGANVFYFVCKDTLEEWIYELVCSKEEMESQVFDGAEQGRDINVIKELIKRLRRKK